jgi:uncharacterized protein
MCAYHVAALQPPHLIAIMPWEGIGDVYGEVNVVGGIPGTPFQHTMWMRMTGNGPAEVEDHAAAALEHPLYDDYWKSKVADWSKITIPVFSVTGWAQMGLHLRGTIDAWNGMASKNKYLLIHDCPLKIDWQAGREWSEYYAAEGFNLSLHSLSYSNVSRIALANPDVARDGKGTRTPRG